MKIVLPKNWKLIAGILESGPYKDVKALVLQVGDTVTVTNKGQE